MICLVAVLSDRPDLKFSSTVDFCTDTDGRLFLQNGDVSYELHKIKTLSPFSASEWELSDGSKTSPGTIMIRKSPFAGHTSFERRDGSCLADMTNRLMMTGSEFCWEGKIYR